MPPLTVEEIKRHSEYDTVVWDLPALEKGFVKVGHGRGGPFKIAYEVHGGGDLKLVWIIGLGGFSSAWQRQLKDFGHGQNTNRGQSTKYSCLVFDNRGMGASDKPLMRYSTTEMAKDTVEVVDHLGWTESRQLHVIGASMGGMIAQEVAYMIPDRVASLSLVCTGPKIFNTIGWLENLRQRIDLFIPRSLDDKLAGIKARIFSAEWLAEPDAEGHFPTNGDRFAAQEVYKRSIPGGYTTTGFILQAIAAGWHYKSPQQLKELGDLVGRRRIQIIHGDADVMVSIPHGRMLAEQIGGEGLTTIWVPRRGHGLHMEWRRGLTQAVAKHVDAVDLVGV